MRHDVKITCVTKDTTEINIFESGEIDYFEATINLWDEWPTGYGNTITEAITNLDKEIIKSLKKNSKGEYL